MASIASHFSLYLSTKQTASSTTPKLSTTSSHLHCFQSSKFLSRRYSLDLNQKCVSVLSAGQGRSLRVCTNSTQDVDQFTTEVEHGVSMTVEVNLGIRSYRWESYLVHWSYPIYIGSGCLINPSFSRAQSTESGPGKAPEFGKPATYVALGGGVIADMCGYEASAYPRQNFHFIQIPTIVMAQVDSSVGGKTGINYSLNYRSVKENFTAENPAFCQPHGVLIDIDTLNTLPDREPASGFAEVIKYGLIRDAQFFEWLEKNMQALMAR